MSRSLELRALLNERLSAVAEEIFQLFQRTIAEYEEELRAKDGSRRQTRALEPVVEESEATRAAGVQMILSYRGEDSPVKEENPVQICIKEDPDLCVRQDDEPLPFNVVSVKVGEEDASFVYQQTAEKAIKMSRKSDRRTKLDFDRSGEMGTRAQMEEGHSSNALFIIGTNGAPQRISPQTFYYSNASSSAANGDKTPLTDSPVAKSEKEPKLHKCAQCGKEYHHSSSLFRHIHTHREQKPFRCSFCQRGFSQKPHLKAHTRIHTGEKPFSCPFCARTFSNKSNLSQHLRVHTGEKPFSCSVCDATFSSLKTLNTHMRIHTGDRPFGCPACGARFKQRTSLEAHMRTHSGEKPYSCSICERSFSQRRSLKKHLEEHAEQEAPGGGDEEVHLVSVQSDNETNESYVTVSI